MEEREDEDDEMIATISSIVGMLDQNNDDVDEEEVATDVISKITNLIGEIDAETNDDEEEEERPPRESQNTSSKTPKKVEVQLPPYPTPYELWKKAHTKKKYGKTPLEYVNSIPVSERNKRAQEVTERLLRRQREEHFEMMKKQHKKLANELRGLTFTPNLHLTQNRNDKFVSTYEPLYKRYNFEIERTKMERMKLEDEARAQELQECTFKPKLSAYSARKAKREESKQSVEERCIQFGLEKQIWAQERRNIIKRIEIEGATFHPKISKKSKELFDKMMIKRIKPENRKRRFKIKGDSRDAGHEQETFHPKINHRSERKKTNKNVYDRLYDRARKRDIARRKFTSKYLDKHVRGVPKPLWTLDTDIPKEFRSAASALSGVERSELRERYGARGIRALPHVCSEGYVNVVEWKENYSFMIGRLSTPTN
eukprot:g3510.t1